VVTWANEWVGWARLSTSFSLGLFVLLSRSESHDIDAIESIQILKIPQYVFSENRLVI
jgi:hypothetical protein